MAIIEGRNFPYYGFAFSIEKTQTMHDMDSILSMDVSSGTVDEVQRIANLIIDDSRYNH